MQQKEPQCYATCLKNHTRTKKVLVPGLIPDMSKIEYIVEEQIDETDIRKIPQIVWAESGSLTVPV